MLYLSFNGTVTDPARRFDGLTGVDAFLDERRELIVRNGDLQGLCNNLPRPLDVERDINAARILRIFMRQLQAANVYVHFYLP
jgi:hypothetical protein